MRTNHKIVNGDCRDMKGLQDSSVHLVITSPPYWQLKDYGSEEQIGFHDSYEKYINNLNLVWKECFRVLHNGCRMCINIGDQFARSVYYGRYKVIPIREEIIKFCENIGFDYMGAVIWQKVTTSNTTGGGVQMGSYPFPRNGILKIDYEFILILKKPGDPPKPDLEQKEQSRMTPEEWNTFFAGHWNFPGTKQNNHIAMFPEELPRRLIKMFSFVGETILDPFLGSGTTSLAAQKLNRSSIGYEINADFIPVIKEKLNCSQHDLLGTTYEFVTEKTTADFENIIKRQPYVFSDPHRLDKKIDVKKLQFGSVIDKDGSPSKNEYFQVERVLSPEKIKLNNGLTIKLIGIEEDSDLYAKAMEFLSDKTKGKKVFLKYDKNKFDDENNLMCYLYLENKTFINAHLIKNGLVKVAEDFDFKYREKFIRLTQNET
jgi:site-specific DNA-methyltransferase (adenine-specific)